MTTGICACPMKVFTVIDIMRTSCKLSTINCVFSHLLIKCVMSFFSLQPYAFVLSALMKQYTTADFFMTCARGAEV